MTDKFTKAAGLLADQGLDAWLITCDEDSDVHSPYLLGVKSHARHFILVDAAGEHQVLAVTMEAPMIKKALDDAGVSANVLAYNTNDEMLDWLREACTRPRIAVNYGEESLLKPTAYADCMHAGELQSLRTLAPETEFVSAADLIMAMRGTKTPEEIDALRESVRITLETLERIPDWVTLDMTEKDVQAKIEYEFLRVGEPSFESIVGSCEHSADPHHNSSTEKIRPGALLLDIGCRQAQVSSDLTWTYWIGGQPPEAFTNAYAAIYESKKVALEFMVAGVETKVPDIKCRESLAAAGYDHETLFFHGFGHALGYECHDIGARVSRNVPDGTVFEENQVYTAEPGLYWAGEFGIRLEDDVIIKKDAAEQVSYVPADPISF